MAGNIIDALMGATSKDLEAIEAKIVELTTQLNSLKAARIVIAKRLNVEIDSPQKRAYQTRSSKKKETENNDANPEESKSSRLANTVYDLLTTEGSMPLPAIAARLKTLPGPLAMCIRSAAVRDWFVERNGEIHIAMKK